MIPRVGSPGLSRDRGEHAKKEALMRVSRTGVALLALVMVACVAGADTKIVQVSHTDAMTVMGQTQPAKDQEKTTWVSADRMRMDQGKMSIIIRPDLEQMLFVDHGSKTYNLLQLPVDLSELLPPQMSQMMDMMKMTVTVTPSGKTKTIGKWSAKHYEMTMSSPMMQMQANIWATDEVGFDLSSYERMAEHMVSLQPGMEDSIEELRKIKGVQVEMDGAISMPMAGNVEVKTSEKLVSIEEVDAPSGFYDPPAGYTEKPFDFMKMQQMQQ